MTKVLLFDIETSPNLAYVWAGWKQNISTDMLVANSHIMSFSARWLGSDQVIYSECRDGNDVALVQELWRLFNEADVVIAHNVKKFDRPVVNSRFVYYGFLPPSPYKMLDTLEVARKEFRFFSNKLSHLAKFLGVADKSTHAKFPGFELWKECLKGNEEAWLEMKTYNIQDVDTLEGVYLKLRPYMPNHPHVGVDEVSCPKCGSTDAQKRGLYRTNLFQYQRYRCNSCGGWYRENIGGVRVSKTSNAS